jgi:hypothetical protein
MVSLLHENSSMVSEILTCAHRKAMELPRAKTSENSRGPLPEDFANSPLNDDPLCTTLRGLLLPTDSFEDLQQACDSL